MQDVIQNELTKVIADWRDGKQVRVIALGHPVRVNPKNGVEESHIFRQKVAYEFVFELLGSFLATADQPVTFEFFTAIGQELAPDFNLSAEELEAALSLAWVVLRSGWNHALTGYAEHRYIFLTREVTA